MMKVRVRVLWMSLSAFFIASTLTPIEVKTSKYPATLSVSSLHDNFTKTETSSAMVVEVSGKAPSQRGPGYPTTRQFLQLSETKVLTASWTTGRRPWWILGVPIALCGSSLTVSGMLMQKFSFLWDQPLESRRVCSCCFNWRWMFGMLLFAIGNGVTWLALGMAPNSVLACFNSWNIIFTMVVAPAVFGEAISRSVKYFAVLLIVGCIWVVCAGPRSYRLRSFDTINLLFAERPFEAITIACGTVVVASLLANIFSKSCDTNARWNTLRVTALAAIFACYSVLFSKCTSMVMAAADYQIVATGVHHQFFLWLGMTPLCASLQIHFLN